MTSPRVLEKTVQAQILHLLRSVGAKVWVTGVPRRRGDFQGAMRTPGLPDLLAFVPPPKPTDPFIGWTLLCVEVKARGGRLREEQADFASCCLNADVAHIVGGLAEVIAWLLRRGLVRDEQLPHYRQESA